MVDTVSSELLLKAVALLGAAVVMVPLFRRLGLGSVLGYLAAGLAIRTIMRAINARSTIPAPAAAPAAPAE